MADTRQTIKVDIGTRVEVELVNQSGETEQMTFIIVLEEQADFKAGFMGVNTPLAKTILGGQAGNILPYCVGDLRRVRILSVEASVEKPAEDVSARREKVIRKAVQHSDYVNAMIFAGSVNSKWGDYDIDKLDPAQWGKEESGEEDELDGQEPDA